MAKDKVKKHLCNVQKPNQTLYDEKMTIVNDKFAIYQKTWYYKVITAIGTVFDYSTQLLPERNLVRFFNY